VFASRDPTVRQSEPLQTSSSISGAKATNLTLRHALVGVSVGASVAMQLVPLDEFVSKPALHSHVVSVFSAAKKAPSKPPLGVIVMPLSR
jgi:hypothetical protein